WRHAAWLTSSLPLVYIELNI
ncbi:hypothetical protein D049_4432B, partial [Vibrio parahaemolyticus VPTS-2010]